MAIALGLLLIPLMLLGILIIPILAALIYKGSYTRHLNEQMETGVVSKKWLSPLAVGLIAFLIEILFIVGCFSLFMVRNNSTAGYHDYIEIDAKDNQSWTFSTDEVKDTEFSVFNGELVENYAMTEGAEGDFYYYAYHRMAGPEDMPEYALLVEYRGDKEVNSFVGNTSFGHEPNTVFLGNGTENSGDGKVVAIIRPGDMVVTTTDSKNGVDTTDTVTINKDDVELKYTLELYEPAPDGASEDFDPEIIDRLTINLSDLSF